jgi:hypothetical protein
LSLALIRTWALAPPFFFPLALAFPQALKTSENKVTVVESAINILSDNLPLNRLSGCKSNCRSAPNVPTERENNFLHFLPANSSRRGELAGRKVNTGSSVPSERLVKNANLICTRLSGKKRTFGHSLLFECGNSKLNYAGVLGPCFFTVYRTTVIQD